MAQQGGRVYTVWMIIFFAAISAIVCRVLTRVSWTHNILSVSLLVTYSLAFLLFLLRSMWTAFGVEEVSVTNGILKQARRLLFWNQTSEYKTADISDIEVRIPAIGARGLVRFTYKGEIITVGEGLSPGEAKEIAKELSKAIPKVHLTTVLI